MQTFDLRQLLAERDKHNRPWLEFLRAPSLTKSRKSSRRRGPILVVHPSIVTGVLMMVGALVWFVLGLMFGWIYFYPPVLFVLGIGAVLRGLRGEQ